MVLEQRNELVAQRVAQYLRETDPYAKTIVFCVDIAHAERMRQQLVNAIGSEAGCQPPLRHAHYRRQPGGQAGAG